MKKYKIVTMCILVGLFCILPLTSYAEEEAAKGKKSLDSPQEIMYRHDAIYVHMSFYYELLIDKYYPEIKEEWKEVTRIREAIEKKMKELRKEGIEVEEFFINEEWMAKHEQYQEEFLLAVKKRDDKEIKAILPQLLELQKGWNDHHLELLQGS